MTDTFTPPAPLQTAVLFLVFNRPDTTEQVFKAIRQAKPPRLYVAADGPRADRVGEAEKVARVREIASAADWPCELKILFRNDNLGCKHAVSGGITWFFEQEKQGIILEDDCLPSQSFFWFCEELLDRYSENKQIMLISGYNKQQEWRNSDCDYFFSNLGGIWGWATWRRAWELYDGRMDGLELLLKSGYFKQILGRKLGKRRGRQLISAKKKNLSGIMSSWAYPWGFTRHKYNGLSCVPSHSLIANIGFGGSATHTVGYDKDLVRRVEINLPTKENQEIIPDKLYDEAFLRDSRDRSLLSSFKSYLAELLR